MVSHLRGQQGDVNVDDVVMPRLAAENPDGSGRRIIERNHNQLRGG